MKTVEMYDPQCAEPQLVTLSNGLVMLVTPRYNYPNTVLLRFYKDNDTDFNLSLPIADVLSPRRCYPYIGRQVIRTINSVRALSIEASRADDSLFDFFVQYAGEPDPAPAPPFTHKMLDKFVVKNEAEFKHLIQWIVETNEAEMDESNLRYISETVPTTGFPMFVTQGYDDYDEEYELEQQHITRQMIIETIRQFRRII